MEKETTKLLNVLRRVAKGAGYVTWTRPSPDAVRFCVTQYNKILARLTQLEPDVQTLFTPLREDASAEVVRIAARELLAYFEADEPDFGFAFGGKFGRGCRPFRARVKCVPIRIGCD